jgi:hypothetical protein
MAEWIGPIFKNASSERTARRRVNGLLWELGLTYHDGLPITDIDRILAVNGFACTESAIYCGRDGHSLEQVGAHSWLSLSWHRMESGRYEVTAYVS